MKKAGSFQIHRVGLLAIFISTLLLSGIVYERQANAEPTEARPLVVDTEKKEIQLYGVIYPERFSAAQGDEAHYHLLVWHKGKSPNALIETPADDLDFHAALGLWDKTSVTIGKFEKCCGIANTWKNHPEVLS